MVRTYVPPCRWSATSATSSAGPSERGGMGRIQMASRGGGTQKGHNTKQFLCPEMAHSYTALFAGEGQGNKWQDGRAPTGIVQHPVRGRGGGIPPIFPSIEGPPKRHLKPHPCDEWSLRCFGDPAASNLLCFSELRDLKLQPCFAGTFAKPCPRGWAEGE